MEKHHKINYLEFQVKSIPASKAFFSEVFGWSFIDYGDTYCSITNASIDAGFYLSDNTMLTETGSALIVLYSKDLEATREKVIHAGGQILKPIFDFPGGRRFHFLDVNSNEFAVWSE